MQGFNWESHKNTQLWWKFFKTKVEDLVELGVTDVWLPPASQSVDKQGTNNNNIFFPFRDS